MSDTDQKAVLLRYLQAAREAVLWKLDGLTEYDQRRPMVPTGTNLLGLVKHLTANEAAYFGMAFDRPFPAELAWIADEDLDRNVDMWARADESVEGVVGLYRRMWAQADETIEALDLDAPGLVPWWRPESRDVTLGQILVHVIAETHRHAGHADILRELIDGAAGLRPENTNLPEMSAESWAVYRAKLEAIAQETAR